MRKHLIRAICILGVLVVLVSCLPLSAFAVDPVSASVIANSFAQAIAAYGASNGVAMTFDVGSTDGIGETVHELWSDFRAGTQDADDYDTLAAALFPNLYYKALTAAGTAAEAYTVGVSITSEYAEEFDNFYNWLLSGPAEMVQVDNQYYQFASSQIGASASPIQVISVPAGSFLGQPCPSSSQTLLYPEWFALSYKICSSGTRTIGILNRASSSGPLYVFHFQSSVLGNSGNFLLVATGDTSTTQFSYAIYDASNSSYSRSDWSSAHEKSYGNFRYNYITFSPVSSLLCPSFSTDKEGLDALASYIASPPVDSVGVKSYTNTGIADIPDTTDPNYDALGRAKDIPLGIPWDDLIYGDGTGALSDAQSGAIADEIAGVLETDSVIPLVEEEEAVNPRPDPDDDPSGDPDDYAVLGLEDVFPFCIPFDIYAFLSALASDPVPPSFSCSFDFPEALGGTQTLELDFDTPIFNQLAQLLRLLELLAFIVGLALLTRSMFIRG